jgi:hypothetical protein
METARDYVEGTIMSWVLPLLVEQDSLNAFRGHFGSFTSKAQEYGGEKVLEKIPKKQVEKDISQI